MQQTRGRDGEVFGSEGSWNAFHQAYDSALRAWRRGPDVSRAVNWLFVASRDGASEEEREMERENREAGLKLGVAAKSEVEIAPLVWRAAREGALLTGPGQRAAVREFGGASTGGAAAGGPQSGTGAPGGSNAPAEGEVGPPAPTDPSTWSDPASEDPRVVYPEGHEPPPPEEGDSFPTFPPAPPSPNFNWDYLI